MADNELNLKINTEADKSKVEELSTAIEKVTENSEQASQMATSAMEDIANLKVVETGQQGRKFKKLLATLKRHRRSHRILECRDCVDYFDILFALKFFFKNIHLHSVIIHRNADKLYSI